MKKGSVTYKTIPHYEYTFEFEDDQGNIETEVVLYDKKPTQTAIGNEHEKILQRKIAEQADLQSV